MVDYQFLGMVAVGLAIVTRGAVLPVLLMTGVIALVSLVYEAGNRRLRRRQDGLDDPRSMESAPASDGELTRWSAVVDRLIHSSD
jgi:hypothetical protein